MQITIREPGSAITHFIAMMMAVFAAVPLLVKAGVQSGQENFLVMAIFMGSMILLYGASATYHSVDLTGKSLRVFRKLDHLSQVVFLCDLHCHGLGMCPGIRASAENSVHARFSLAVGRRHHLHRGRCHLCPEAADLQCET